MPSEEHFIRKTQILFRKICIFQGFPFRWAWSAPSLSDPLLPITPPPYHTPGTADPPRDRYQTPSKKRALSASAGRDLSARWNDSAGADHDSLSSPSLAGCGFELQSGSNGSRLPTLVGSDVGDASSLEGFPADQVQDKSDGRGKVSFHPEIHKVFVDHSESVVEGKGNEQKYPLAP